MFKKILVPVDIHEPEVAAPGVLAATELAKTYDGEIRLVHVRAILPTGSLDSVPHDYYAKLEAHSNAGLEAAATTVALPADRVSTASRMGSVHDEVLDEAKSWGADLIVVGAHRRSMASYLLGSSAAAIARHATCAVLIVRSDKAAKLFG
ncbi:MAG: universal stress protein [Phreatobacter sp.]|nr:universal stress protein [Phreatobacter sp.]